MKSEWEFQFTTHGFRFDREYTYRAKFSEKVSLGGRELEILEPVIRIVPNDREPFPDSDQTGSLYILLPYPPQETREIAFYLATLIAERTSFSHGDFRIIGGLVFSKRVPETPDEELEVGDSPYSAEVKLVEAILPTKFDSNALLGAPRLAVRLPLMAQFNEAKRISQPVLRFVGFFKIIESLTHAKNESRALKDVLSTSTELRRIYNTLNTSLDFDSFIRRAAKARHNCAHLKLANDFGYSPLDADVQSEVKPLLQILEALAQESIHEWGQAGA